MKDKPHRGIDSSHPLTRRDNYGRFGRIGTPSQREISREEALADWLGEERTPDVFAKLRPDAHPIAALVDAIITNVKVVEIELLDKIRQHWVDIVGADNASHFVPLSTNHEILEVGFINAAWRFMLDTPPQRQLILKRITEQIGTELKSIRFVPYVGKSGTR